MFLSFDICKVLTEVTVKPPSKPLIPLSSVGVGCVTKMTEKRNELGGKENDSK